MLALTPRAERAAWLAILVVAAALRFAGLAHHVVRGSPDFDEQNNFVRPIERMWRDRTIDPTVYQGYAGFFNWLAAAPVLVSSRLAGHAGAYAAGRGVVACFGLANVLLAGLVARRYASPGAGLFAGALLAVSRLDVRAAHHITPDVLVGFTVLGVLLLIDLDGLSRRRDAGVAALIGVGSAVKYTGLLAAVPAGVALLLRGGVWSRAPRMAVVAAATFALAAPYAVLELMERGTKVSGLLHYYGERPGLKDQVNEGAQGFANALGYLEQGVGPVGLALAAGAPLLLVDRKRLLPALATVAAGIAAMAPAAFVYPRHVVPVAVVASVLAGAGFAAALARAGQRAPVVGLLLLATSLPFQAREALRLTVHYLEPSAVDRAADWIEADASRHGIVATSLPRLALAREHFEVRRLPELLAVPRVVLGQFDLVVAVGAKEAAGLSGFPVLARFPSEDGLEQRLVTVLAPPADARTRLRPVPVTSIGASANADRARLAVDGASSSAWRAPAGPGSLELGFASAVMPLRVEIEAGPEPAAWPQRWQLSGGTGAGEWREIASEFLRPNSDERQRDEVPRGQVFVLTGGDVLTGLRLERARGGTWSVAEIRVLTRDAEPPGWESTPTAAPTRRRPRRRH